VPCFTPEETHLLLTEPLKHSALRDEVKSQGRVPGEWEYLAGFARRETQPVPEDEEVRRALNRRQLCMKADSGEWRQRVPLMGRWLRKEW